MVAALSRAARLKNGLARTREVLNTPVSELFVRRRVDESLFEDLQTALLQADCGVAATDWLLESLREKARRERIEDAEALKRALTDSVTELLRPLERSLDVSRARPFTIMIAGVNGSGKTTSIGKLAKWLQSQGKSVLLAAGDTFRAAAREQLVVWGERNAVPVIAQAGGDPGAVIYDALNAARSRAKGRCRCSLSGWARTSTTCARSRRRNSPRRWLVSFSAVAKRYAGGEEALRGVSFAMEAGELVFITGRSGAGKSTLLKLIP